MQRLSSYAEIALLQIATYFENAWKGETYNMPVDFLSDKPWEVLICRPGSQNGGASTWNCARNSVALHDSFYRGPG
jgi:hypothetical protein